MEHTAEDARYLLRKGALSEDDIPHHGNKWAWDSYAVLRKSRGMTGAIPIGEIAAWCDFNGWHDPILRTRLARFVMAMDAAEREFNGKSRS